MDIALKISVTGLVINIATLAVIVIVDPKHVRVSTATAILVAFFASAAAMPIGLLWSIWSQ